MMSAKKVLHVIPGFGGGISSLVRNIVLNSNPDILINDIVGFSEYPDFFQTEVTQKGGKTFTLPSVRKVGKKQCQKEFIAILKQTPYDAVHIHVGENQFLFFAVSCKIAGVKRIIAHSHITNSDHINEWKYRMKLRFWRLAEAILATQRASCSKMASEFLYGKRPVKKNKIMHIPNGVNMERFAKTLSDKEKFALKESLGITPGTFVVGHVGYFGYQKNHEFMLKLISQMKNKYYDFVWLFIGDGWNMEKIIKMADELQVSGYIKFLGRRNDVADLFQIMDVFILPSHFEGLPTVSVESQAAGTPVLMSDTITDEVDLKLNLVKYLSLNDSTDEWIKSLFEMAKVERIPREQRVRKINELFFTSETVARLYEDFIQGYISHYDIGDSYTFQPREKK